jgi:GntR family transcriptional regulator
MSTSKKSIFTDFNISPVDPHSPLPLYYQVYVDLRNIIRSGKLKAGEMLPPELELSEAYGVGRETIRHAFLKLVDDNIVERKAGRGTVVLAQKDQMRFYLDRSFAQQMMEMGMVPHSEVLKINAGVIDVTSPESLQKKSGAQCLTLVRLRFGDQTPIGIQYTTVITELCPGLINHDFANESLYGILGMEYKLPITRINQVISAISADEWHCSLLKTVSGAPLLLVRTTAYLDNGEPIESTTSYYRADKYWYSTYHEYHESGKP